MILLDREIEGYKKSTTEEQERNETLTLQLNRFQMDAATSKTLISQKQAQYEALQAHYSTSLRILRETENTLVRLTKVGRRDKVFPDSGCPSLSLLLLLFHKMILSFSTPFLSFIILGKQQPPGCSK